MNSQDMGTSRDEGTSRRRVQVNSDEALREDVARVRERRSEAGLDGLVGDLAAVIINTEPENHEVACSEYLRYTGHDFREAFESSALRTTVLSLSGSADLLLTSRLTGENPFGRCTEGRCAHLPNTRLETLVFQTPDLRRYMAIQQERGVEFLSDDVIGGGDCLFAQTAPSVYTGNSTGFVQWLREDGSYAPNESHALAGLLPKPDSGYQGNVHHLDHVATRVVARDRDPAILEFTALTNYDFAFAIHVDELNSITNVARLEGGCFAMVFTSGVRPYVNDIESGATEKFVHHYGARAHHLAFLTQRIEETYAALLNDGMRFLVGLVGSPEEGLHQTFTEGFSSTMLVNEYIHRYGDFDGFFTRHNVAVLTEATGNQ